MLRKLIVISILFFAQHSFASEEERAFNKLLKNISPAGASQGAVIASPSRHDPDYFFHWVRDGALVMDIVLKKWISNPRRISLKKILLDYVDFSQVNQMHFSPVGLGEPKYYVDGRPYDGPWGRPQNDGPALRALVLTRLAVHLINQGEINYVRQKLYDSFWPTISVIKKDLQYVANNWSHPSFDLWEEIKGQHFYTRMAQRTALLEGADLAEYLGDLQSAELFRAHARSIGYQLNHHFQTKQLYIVENLNHVEGLNYKYTGLDTASILAVLHTQGPYNAISLDDDYLLQTILGLEQNFKDIYPINAGIYSNSSAVFGRYPEDQYYGGNPWFLTTLAIAEHHYLLVEKMQLSEQIILTDVSRPFFVQLLQSNLDHYSAGIYQKNHPLFQSIQFMLAAKADGYINRVRSHRGEGESIWEQMNKHTGFMTSAKDLTWSYAALITALMAKRN